MPSPRITVRSKTSGLTTEIAARALAHFPDYEPVDTPAESAAPGLPSANAAEGAKANRTAKTADK